MSNNNKTLPSTHHTHTHTHTHTHSSDISHKSQSSVFTMRLCRVKIPMMAKNRTFNLKVGTLVGYNATMVKIIKESRIWTSSFTGSCQLWYAVTWYNPRSQSHLNSGTSPNAFYQTAQSCKTYTISSVHFKCTDHNKFVMPYFTITFK